VHKVFRAANTKCAQEPSQPENIAYTYWGR
jgi:hypothetical protein